MARLMGVNRREEICNLIAKMTSAPHLVTMLWESYASSNS